MPARTYIAEFDILIEKDEDFQVIERIEGCESNFKRIIESCRKGDKGISLSLQHKTSSTQIGSNQIIKIESKHPEYYQKACRMVSELLLNIFEEYKRFCSAVSKHPISNTYISHTEHIVGERLGVFKIIDSE